MGKIVGRSECGQVKSLALDVVSVRRLLGILAEMMMEQPDFRSLTLGSIFWAGERDEA